MARLDWWQAGHITHDSGPPVTGAGLRGTATEPVPSGVPQVVQKRCWGTLGAPHFAQVTIEVGPRPPAPRGDGPGSGFCESIASERASAISVACWKRSDGSFSSAFITTACTAGEMRGLRVEGSGTGS